MFKNLQQEAKAMGIEMAQSNSNGVLTITFKKGKIKSSFTYTKEEIADDSIWAMVDTELKRFNIRSGGANPNMNVDTIQA